MRRIFYIQSYGSEVSAAVSEFSVTARLRLTRYAQPGELLVRERLQREDRLLRFC